MTSGFRFLLTKEDAGAFHQLAWCPNKDVIGMLAANRQAWLQRAGSGDTWQQLSSLSASLPQPGKGATAAAAAIESLCWRPDGTAVACGLEDGSLAILEPEQGSCLFHCTISGARLVSLLWVVENYGPKPQPSALQLSHYLQVLAALPPLKAFTKSEYESDDSAEPLPLLRSFSSLDLLVARGSAGDVWLRAGGIFDLGYISVINSRSTENLSVVSSDQSVDQSVDQSIDQSVEMNQSVDMNQSDRKS